MKNGIRARLFALAYFTWFVGTAAANLLDITGPSNSGTFGAQVVVLPNHNIVVVDPTWPSGGSAGAVYVYSPKGDVISTLTGNGGTGSGGIFVLTNGNFVVASPGWSSGKGAATWIDANTGLNGQISSSNSLVGNTTGVRVGYNGVATLANGNYVVSNGDHSVTWGNGTSGVIGTTSMGNSFYGGVVKALPNGNFLIINSTWSNGQISYAGAVTWADGSMGITGTPSPQVSLVGDQQSEFVGQIVSVLSNGNYVVTTYSWDYGVGVGVNAGAVTWADGTKGVKGTVSSTNSMTGINDGDGVGSGGIVVLPNGNYLVKSPSWHEGAAANVGAVTLMNGNQPAAGNVSAINSLTGAYAENQFGSGGVTVLTNGNYVVLTNGTYQSGNLHPCSATWGSEGGGTVGHIDVSNSLITQSITSGPGLCNVTPLANGNYAVSDIYGVGGRGAVILGSGTSGISGTMSSVNSLIGPSTLYTQVGSGGVFALPNGNYVVCSPLWFADLAGPNNLGAATWGDGVLGTAGEVGPGNSVVGLVDGDSICSGGVSVLNNGNYLVRSPHWNNGATANAGAVTWVFGGASTSGIVTNLNSLVGTTSNELLGSDPIITLTHGNYVISNVSWDNGAVANAGAAIWGNGQQGVFGPVSPLISLVGTQTNDQLGKSIVALPNDRYVVKSPSWHNGMSASVGAITLASGGNSGPTGVISPASTVFGTIPAQGSTMIYAYDAAADRLVVGQPASNVVTLLDSDTIFFSNFE